MLHFFRGGGGGGGGREGGGGGGGGGGRGIGGGVRRGNVLVKDNANRFLLQRTNHTYISLSHSTG